MTEGADILAHDAPPPHSEDAGMMLRAGRESAGLSVAAVAGQLKLAPRQIAALEDGDFTKLPGRTFVRGFVRNYARLLRLDADAVLAALPEAAAPSSLEHPSLAPTPRPMGELPADANARPSAARWAIPLALVAIVTIAAVYEITRPPAGEVKPAANDKAVGTPSMAPSTSEPAQANTTMALPNPLAVPDKTDAAPDTSAAPANAGDSPGNPPPMPNDPDAGNTLSFQGTSWVEVRDGTGTLILHVTGNAGATQPITGHPPFDVVLGNAAAVTVSWQGKPFDTAPFTRQNVARFTLK